MKGSRHFTADILAAIRDGKILANAASSSRPEAAKPGTQSRRLVPL
jgi:hypothetical protein